MKYLLQWAIQLVLLILALPLLICCQFLTFVYWDLKFSDKSDEIADIITDLFKDKK